MRYRSVALRTADAYESHELTREEWAEFRFLTTGRRPWVPAPGTVACPECKTLGHIHGKNCSIGARDDA